MNNSLILNEKILRRIPPLFVFFLIVVLGMPAIALNYFGVSFSNIADNIASTQGMENALLELKIRGYFRQTLLQWSAFSLSAITVLFSFTQYRLTNDKIALTIGLSVLFSGAAEALHTIVINSTSTALFINKDNLDAVVWTITNSISGLIILFGLLFILRDEDGRPLRGSTTIWLSLLLIVGAFTVIYYAATQTELPDMWFEESIIYRPYELIYVGIYLFIIIGLYPKLYKSHPYILTNCIFYMAVTEIVIALYIMLLSSTPNDAAYNIAYFLKLIVYFAPFSCLIINYMFSYNAILAAQELLRTNAERLKYIAAHDPLTQLYNRREFEVLLDKMIANSNRGHSNFALFVIDMDNFKSINDTLGHIHGDDLLKQFCVRLTSLTRKGDTLSRIGGDEFTLITAKLKTISSARKLADRIVSGLNAPFMIDNKLLTCTVSIGIAIYPQDGENTESLLKNADIAMYSSKRSGKNTYRFYTKNLSKVQHREAEIEAHLREALKNDELSLYFQPIYELSTREIKGAEVLLRWHSPKLGEISPSEFIPVAEQTGLIIAIGNWVLDKTCEKAKAWLEFQHKTLQFAVNISPEQFENSDFLHQLQKSLELHHLPAENLTIEITERLLLNLDDELLSTMHKISKLGVKISIDDFGMGYSSLSRLESLAIDSLKIDKLFLTEIDKQQSRVIVIDTIVSLGQELGLDIIAEGIETKTQLDYLKQKHCHLGQGYYLSKPLNSQDFEKLAFAKK